MIRVPKWKERIDTEKKLNDDYQVKINGEECEVRECRVSAMPYNRIWMGVQRPIDQTELASYISVFSDENAVFEIKAKKEFKNAFIKPYSKNIKVEVSNDIIRFTLTEFGQYVLELDDSHCALHIFYNEIKDYPEKEKATYYFGPGIHFARRIELKDNDIIYVDEEAVVYTVICGKNVKNVKIFGGGVIDGGMEERVFPSGYTDVTTGVIRLYNSENISVKDVIIKDSAVWIFSMFDCADIEIDGIKIVGHWKYNTDGIDVCNSKNVVIRNSFIRAFDDVITIKGLYNAKMCVENILIENCVMWCDWGRNAEIGHETATAEIKNITFKNCDLLYSSFAALSIHHGNEAEIHHVTYENINVEYSLTETPPVFHNIDDEKYSGYGETHVPPLIFASTTDRRPQETQLEGPVYGNIHDILYKNINVYLPEGIDKPEINFSSIEGGPVFKNFTVDGLYVNGEKQENFNNFKYICENVENVVIK